MTIEELKDLGEVETGEALFDLRNEILALVEAANVESVQWDMEGNRTLEALDAFNARLASL